MAQERLYQTPPAPLEIVRNPIAPITNPKELRKELRNATDYPTTQAVLSRITRNCYETDRKRKNRLLLSVNEIAPKSIHLRRDQTLRIAQSLDGKIAMNHFEMPYFNVNSREKKDRKTSIIARKDRKKAREILLSDPDLAEFRRKPVVQICGTRVKDLPTTWNVANKNIFKPLNTILAENGVRIGGKSGIKLKKFFPPDSPVEIFAHKPPIKSPKHKHPSYYFPAEKKEAVETYIQRRKEELLLTRPQLSGKLIAS